MPPEQRNPERAIARTTDHILALGHQVRDGQVVFGHDVVLGIEFFIHGGLRVARHVPNLVVENHVVVGERCLHGVQEFRLVRLNPDAQLGIGIQEGLSRLQILVVTGERRFLRLVIAAVKEHTGAVGNKGVLVLQVRHDGFNGRRRRKIMLDEWRHVGVIEVLVMHILLFYRFARGANGAFRVGGDRDVPVMRQKILGFDVLGAVVLHLVPGVHAPGMDGLRRHVVLVEIIQDMLQENGST